MDDAAIASMASMVDGLRMRMEAVERRADAWRRATFAALALASLALIAIVALFGLERRRDGLDEAELRTRRLVIEGEDGAERAALESNDDGTSLRLNGAGVYARLATSGGGAVLNLGGDADAPFVLIETESGSTPRAGMRAEVPSASTWAEITADESARLGGYVTREHHTAHATVSASASDASADLQSSGTRTSLVASPTMGQVQTAHTTDGATTEARLSASDTQGHLGAAYEARGEGAQHPRREFAAYAQRTDASASATDSEMGFAGLSTVRGAPSLSTEDAAGHRWSSAPAVAP